MINDLDEALRRLLIRELPIKNGEVDIQFKQPTREWSAKLNRPTLDLFLYDLRENAKLRQPSPQWMIQGRSADGATQRRHPVRLDAHYVITVWANEPEDEHRLLSRTLMGLFRNPDLPEDLLPESLLAQPSPIQLLAAQSDKLQETSLFWSALDNEIRPVITCTLTFALDPYHPITTPLVRERVLVFENMHTGAQESPGRVLWTVQGHVRNLPRGAPTHLTLVERELHIPVQADGSFTIGNVPAGEYTIEVTAAARTSRHTLTVPSQAFTVDAAT